jgi:hypothetical protein
MTRFSRFANNKNIQIIRGGFKRYGFALLAFLVGVQVFAMVNWPTAIVGMGIDQMATKEQAVALLNTDNIEPIGNPPIGWHVLNEGHLRPIIVPGEVCMDYDGRSTFPSRKSTNWIQGNRSTPARASMKMLELEYVYGASIYPDYCPPLHGRSYFFLNQGMGLVDLAIIGVIVLFFATRVKPQTEDTTEDGLIPVKAYLLPDRHIF